MTEIERGTTYRIEAEVKDANDTITDPDQSDGEYQITITIEDASDGDVEIDEETMNRSSEGKFYYDWETSSTDETGQYFVIVSAVISDKTVLNRDYVELVDVK
ncbi:MAG: hypothetical protein ACLFVB_10865 [Thermoplasmata archaeon]